MRLLSAKFAQVDASILDIQTQIASLQTKLTELQDYRQQLQSVEQACESALSQVDTALMMLHHVDPSQINTFKEALAIKFTEAIGVLEPAAQTDPERAPRPTAPITPDAALDHENMAPIEVQAEPEPEPEPEATPATAPETEPVDIHVAEDPVQEQELATQAELETLTIQQIRRLAATKKAGGSGTKASIAARLAGLVSKEDIWRIA